MQQIEQIVHSVSDFLWGPPMLILLMGTHIFFTFRLKFIQRFIGRAIRISFQKSNEGKGEISHFGALTTALAATIGTGNIVGVATAIAAGGPVSSHAHDTRKYVNSSAFLRNSALSLGSVPFSSIQALGFFIPFGCIYSSHIKKGAPVSKTTSTTEKETWWEEAVFGLGSRYKTTISDGTNRIEGRGSASEKSQEIASDKWEKVQEKKR